jgi:predicted DNA-binding transcriptional regulator AlpA
MGFGATEREPRAYQLDPAAIDQLAERLSGAIVRRVVEALRAERLIPRESTETSWLDAKEVAQRLGFTLDWVYEHADELGASRIGTGPRPRLRFPPHVVDRRRTSQTSGRAAGQNPEPRPRPSGLIPIRGS